MRQGHPYYIDPGENETKILFFYFLPNEIEKMYFCFIYANFVSNLSSFNMCLQLGPRKPMLQYHIHTECINRFQ